MLTLIGNGHWHYECPGCTVAQLHAFTEVYNNTLCLNSNHMDSRLQKVVCFVCVKAMHYSLQPWRSWRCWQLLESDAASLPSSSLFPAPPFHSLDYGYHSIPEGKECLQRIWRGRPGVERSHKRRGNTAHQAYTSISSCKTQQRGES